MENNIGKIDYDDKDLVILAVLILGIMSMFLITDAEGIVGNIVSGLFGIAVGKRLN